VFNAFIASMSPPPQVLEGLTISLGGRSVPMTPACEGRSGDRLRSSSVAGEFELRIAGPGRLVERMLADATTDLTIDSSQNDVQAGLRGSEQTGRAAGGLRSDAL
jgi:hypothetical protein